ncbi:hypothetical protein GCM10010170_036430 [Dactylosporangium salmoneum]|uniref:Uncharacterized protein n=2 Tax=Dactylosporangium salmoneum TaxID=53361 RepID=A0ABN3GBZ2_9ACTN
MRVIFGVLGAATLVYGALVATSLAGGPLEPQQLLPFPDLVNNLPVLDPQQPVTQPGAKGTPAAKSPVTQAKKITDNKPSQIEAVPLPSGAPVTTTAPAGDATTTPAAEGTDAPPSAQPSKSPAPSTKPSGRPSSPPPSAGPTEGTTSSGAVTPPLGTDQVGETTTGQPGVSPRVSSGSTTSGTGGTVASPSASASLGAA